MDLNTPAQRGGFPAELSLLSGNFLGVTYVPALVGLAIFLRPFYMAKVNECHKNENEVYRNTVHSVVLPLVATSIAIGVVAAALGERRTLAWVLFIASASLAFLVPLAAAALLNPVNCLWIAHAFGRLLLVTRKNALFASLLFLDSLAISEGVYELVTKGSLGLLGGPLLIAGFVTSIAAIVARVYRSHKGPPAWPCDATVSWVRPWRVPD
jgi:hypothetical protein